MNELFKKNRDKFYDMNKRIRESIYVFNYAIYLEQKIQNALYLYNNKYLMKKLNKDEIDLLKRTKNMITISASIIIPEYEEIFYRIS